jgi:hypothetical protein
MKTYMKMIFAFFCGALACAAAGSYWLHREYMDMGSYLREQAEVRLSLAVDWIAQTDPVHIANVAQLSAYLDADALKDHFRVSYSTNRHFFTLRPLIALEESPYIFLSEIGNTNFPWTSSSSVCETPEATLITLLPWHTKYETSIETNRIEFGDEVVPYLYSPDSEDGSVMSAIIPMADKQMLIGILGFKYSDVDFLRDEEGFVTEILKHRRTQQPAVQLQSERAPSD